MEKVWVLMWYTNEGTSGVGGVFEKLENAIDEVLHLFSVGEEETEERLILDSYVHIYTNQGGYQIERRVVR